MSAISLKSITGITSITTPAGVDNQLTLHTNNTTERVKIDVAGNVHVNNHLNITGVTTTSDNIKIQADNKYLSIGAHTGGDLLAYHDGNKSVIVNYTGDFHIRTNNGSRSSLEGIILKPNGATEIYHSGSKIIETDSLGVNVDGRLDVVGTGANDHLNVGTNTGRLRIGGYADLQLFHDSTNINYISNHNDVDLHIVSTYGGSPVKTQAKFIHNGAVELYHNNIERFETTSQGINVIGHSELDNVSIVGVTTFNGLSTNDVIRVRSADSNGNCVVNILSEGTTGNSRILFSDTAATSGDGWISYSHNDRALTFTTAGTSNERLRITSAGNIGINSSAPQALLDIEGTGTLAKFGSTDSTYETLFIRNNTTGYPAIANDSSDDTIELRSAGSVQVAIDYNNNKTDKYFRVVANQHGSSGTEVFRVQENGKVGIGTDDPKQNVSITNGRVNIDSRGDYYGVWIDGDTTATSAVNIGRWHNTGGRIKNGGSSYNDLIIETMNTSHKLQLQPTGGDVMIGTTTEGFATYGDNFTIADSGHCGMTIRSGTTNYGTIYFSDGDDGSAAEVRGFVEYNHSTNALSLGADGSPRLRIKNDGKVIIGNTSGSGTGALTIYPASLAGNGRLDVYGGGDENSQNAARNEVMRIGRGDIIDQYYHSIWSATGSGGSNSHFLKFYVSNGNAGATNQLEALSMSGNGHVTKPQHPTFHARLINHKNATQNPLIYDDVPVNRGSHYKTSGSDQGKFVAPIAGLYFFYWAAIKNNLNGQVTRLYINKNGSRIYNSMHLRLQEDGSYANGSIQATVSLAVGDKIHIELANGGVHGSEYTHFGGYLIG